MLFINNNLNKPVKKDDMLVNENIRAKEVFLIGNDGYQYGVKSLNEALFIADREGFDLVCVAPNATPVVCKLIDYSRYRYEQQRKMREQKKNQKVVEIKGMRLSAQIDDNDFETKVRNGRKFLEDGDKLKVSLKLTGRMMTYSKQAIDIVKKYAGRMDDIATLDKDPILEGRMISATLTPKKNK